MTHVHMSQPLRPSRFVDGPDAKEGEANGSEEKQFQPVRGRFVKSRDTDQPLKSAFVVQAAALSCFFFPRVESAKCRSALSLRWLESIRQYQTVSNLSCSSRQSQSEKRRVSAVYRFVGMSLPNDDLMTWGRPSANCCSLLVKVSSASLSVNAHNRCCQSRSFVNPELRAQVMRRSRRATFSRFGQAPLSALSLRSAGSWADTSRAASANTSTVA